MKNVKGFKELDNLLKDLPKQAEARVLQNATMAGLRVALRPTIASAPVGKEPRSKSSKKYGPLRARIRVERLRKYFRVRGKRGARIATTRAFWGLFQEVGTRHIPARPWLRPAFEAYRKKMISKMYSNMVKGIEREVKKLAIKHRTLIK